MKKILKLFVLLAAIVAPVLTSCKDDDDDGVIKKNKEVVTYKVAVIMPGSQQSRWEDIANWALENLKIGQQNEVFLDKVITLDLEWYDEDKVEGLTEFVSRVEADPQYKAIIGPLRTENAYTVATLCEKHHKPLILPQCTSTEVQRIFAESPNVFNLTQSDIGQAEVMVSLALARHAPSISLLVHSGDVSTAEAQLSYGATFRNWLGFLACEAGLPVDTVCLYDNTASMRQAVIDLTNYYQDNYDPDRDNQNQSVLMFVPEKPEELVQYDKIRAEQVSAPGKAMHYPFTLCSNTAVSDNDLFTTNFKFQYAYEGVDIAPSTTSGFTAAYQSRFGYNAYPIGGEPQLFDALYIVTYALALNPDDVSGSIASISDVSGKDYYLSWFPKEIGAAMVLFQRGTPLSVSGALGQWQFDKRYHASLLNTTYRHWRMTDTDGSLCTLQYITLTEGKRSTNNEQLWRMNTSVRDEFDPYQIEDNYLEKEGNYAFLVAASTGWQNYRHQADVLDIYQMLKRHGYDDDHIILIMEGDILTDTHNKYPNEVRVQPGGVNLYNNVTIDYRTSTLTPTDILNILSGKATERTPNVLKTTNKDNIFFFWSGHGNDGLLYLDRHNLYDKDVNAALKSMFFDNRYRKIFWVIEACYSGSIGESNQDVPGLLMLTAANASETSKADIMDPVMNIWLSNGFTRAFCDAVERDNNSSMRDLYYYVAQHTAGSHATMYNFGMYGNMFKNTIKEYLP